MMEYRLTQRISRSIAAFRIPACGTAATRRKQSSRGEEKKREKMRNLGQTAGLEVAGGGALQEPCNWPVLQPGTSAAPESLPAADGCSRGTAAVLEEL